MSAAHASYPEPFCELHIRAPRADRWTLTPAGLRLPPVDGLSGAPTRILFAGPQALPSLRNTPPDIWYRIVYYADKPPGVELASGYDVGGHSKLPLACEW
jgi:hypothetical protein